MKIAFSKESVLTSMTTSTLVVFEPNLGIAGHEDVRGADLHLSAPAATFGARLDECWRRGSKFRSCAVVVEGRRSEMVQDKNVPAEF